MRVLLASAGPSIALLAILTLAALLRLPVP